KTNVITYDADTPVEAIHQFLCRVSIRRVVVVSGSRPIGTISRGTILRLFRNLVAAADERAGETPLETRKHLIESSRQLAAIGQDFLAEVEQAPGPTTSEVAGRAAQMQGLLNDMLACSTAAPASDVVANANESWQESAAE
ncbi:MAG TPA: hypothetical protein DD670_17285, partial [Planctomycetaceae bacterium]|nr:hypothetical protein [Planctomycetaceae bacterium]